jgi:hypothetical protein
MTNYDCEVETIGWMSEPRTTASDWILGAVAVIGIAAFVYLFLFL